MQVNEYDTFSYEKPADYVPRMKEVYGEINEGFERAEQMAKVNDRQRLANAEIMGNAINNAYKFSTKMGKYLEAEQEKRETKYIKTLNEYNCMCKKYTKKTQ